ncbi:hypothetical protein B4119_2220 [Parageobacillus caldoxylosilyticus]|uniref:Uncharacterized protein n=1 Tax=Saccharococcus caldoxylosilyticus TaxID=81408 RepID=A0A150LV37_9BACL|nr:hypothetical protein B4119_2220 [Parageobacillus caldoxylosilyticus]
MKPLPVIESIQLLLFSCYDESGCSQYFHISPPAYVRKITVISIF